MVQAHDGRYADRKIHPCLGNKRIQEQLGLLSEVTSQNKREVWGKSSVIECLSGMNKAINFIPINIHIHVSA